MNTTNKIIKTLLGAALSLLVTIGLTQHAAAAPLIVNGSFEEGSFSPDGSGFMSLPPGSTEITGWRTFSDELVWAWSDNVSDWPASDGNYFLDLTGYHDSLPYGGIQQTLTTASGTRYRITFDLSVNQSSEVSRGPVTVRVEATGNSPQEFTYDPPSDGIQWGRFAFDFVAVGPSTDLSFLGTFAAGGRTINLDNVSGEAVGGCPNASFAEDAIIWHQPLARNGASEDTDPSAGRTVKYRFKRGSTIPIQVHALGCTADVTSNANVIGKVTVFGDSNCDGAMDDSAAPIDFNGVGGGGGVMDKIGGHLKYNLDTKSLPTTTQCYILRVTVTDTSTGQEKFEEVLLQAK